LVVNIPTILLFPWLANRVTQSWRLLSFLFSSAYLHAAGTANQVRMYGLGLLWTVLAIVLWDNWREKPSTGRLVAWTLTMVLLVYTHFFGLLMVIAFVAVNWLYGPRWWAFTGAAVVPGLTYLLWFLYVLPEYLARGLGPNLTWVNIKPYRALAELPFSFLGGMHLPRWRIVLAVVALLIQVVVFVLAWRAVRRLWPPRRDDETTSRWFWTAVMLAGVPVVLLFLFSIAIRPAFHARFVFGALPAYWLLLVLLGQLGGRAGRVMLYGIVVPWVLVSSGFALAEQLEPTSARLGTLHLARELRANDLILCENLSFGNQVYWEWTGRLGRFPVRIEVLRPVLDVGRLSIAPLTDLGNLELNGVDRVWFFFHDKKETTAVMDFLAARGFFPEKQAPEIRSFLLAFTRAYSP
jgi:hypothetical protein